MRHQVPPRVRHISERSDDSCGSSASAPAGCSSSGSGKENSGPQPPRRPSLGFLDEEAQLDNEKLKQKKEKFKATADGYQVPRKLSVQNVDYNVCSQDISRMVVKAKPLVIPGIAPKHPAAKPKSGRRITWRDQVTSQQIVDIRLIERANKGRKISGKDVVETFRSSSSSSSKPGKDVSMDDFLKAVLEWAPGWIREQKNCSRPPKVEGKLELLPLPDTFASWTEYRNIFMPLLLHELWAMVTREVEEKEALREEVVPVILQEVAADGGELGRGRGGGGGSRFRQFMACTLINEHEARKTDLALDGTLVILNLSYIFSSGNSSKSELAKQPKEIRPCFGFVRRVWKEPLHQAGRTEQDKINISILEKESAKNEHRKNMAYLVRYHITVKGVPPDPERSLCTTRPIIMRVLTRIKPELRKVQALLELNKSPLFKSIISPDLRFLGVNLGTENLHPAVKDIPQMKMLNSMQKRIIVGVSRACLDDPKTPKIALVQGPPGTGKSATIAGMILQIWAARSGDTSSCPAPRLLVVAPSNAAVDELALKLIAVREYLPENRRFNLIRLGVSGSTHRSVLEYTFDARVRQIIDADTRKEKNAATLENAEKNKQQEANKLYEEKLLAEGRGQLDLAAKLERDYKVAMKEKEKLREALSRPLERRKQKDLEASAEKRVMAGADIFLSTLSSSVNLSMENYFLRGSERPDQLRPISVCIMDEASQCVEPEALIPFKLGFNKLVMVGDPAQLPATVLSQTAKEQDFHQSLFKRFFKIYNAGLGPDGKAISADIHGLTKGTVMKLDTQYRMHREIGDWPGRYFYGGLLAPGEQERSSPLAPYTILHLDSQETAAKGGVWNKEEEKLSVDTAEAVRRLVNRNRNTTIGIITFYAKQKQNIHLEVQNRRLQDYVTVNTVDGYQGSERDVIIMSCVRAGGETIGFLEDMARLNVGLTRARQALIIIANIHTLGKCSAMWRELIQNAVARGAVFTADSKLRLEEVLAVKRRPNPAFSVK